MEEDFPKSSSVRLMFSLTPEDFQAVHTFDKGYAPFIDAENSSQTSLDNVEQQTGGRVRCIWPTKLAKQLAKLNKIFPDQQT